MGHLVPNKRDIFFQIPIQVNIALNEMIPATGKQNATPKGTRASETQPLFRVWPDFTHFAIFSLPQRVKFENAYMGCMRV